MEADIGRQSLGEMAPRMKILAREMPGWVRDLEDWQARAREYGDRHVRPRALEIDRRAARDPAYFDWDLVRRATPYGFLSMSVPEGAGGGGQLTTGVALVMEELCAACAGVANIFGATGLGLSGILMSLDFYHIDRASAEAAAGDRLGEPVIFAAAITEPMAGSDTEDEGYMRTARLVCEARRVAGGYVLDGRKVFISNGSVARYATVVMPLDRRRPVETLTTFLVKQGDPGLSVGRIEEKMGMKACPAAELVFDGCFVPEENRVGSEGEAMRGVMTVLGASRGPVGAIATGIARGALERAVAFARQKRVGGRRLIDEQWVRIKLAEMTRRVHYARQAYLDACMAFDFTGVPKLMKTLRSRMVMDWVPLAARRGEIMTRALGSAAVRGSTRAALDRTLDPEDQRHIQQCASMAKITGSDVAVWAAGEALQIAGLEASLHRMELEKIFRDAKLTQIYEGTNQLNRHNVYINTFGIGHDGGSGSARGEEAAHVE